ncbi:MAG: hypothetical protein V7637_4398 [Mycobacteriales bacterium]
MGTVAPARAPAWPFVGRGLEVDRFADALRDPGVDAALVTGPAGVGKSRYAEACVRAAECAGSSVVLVTGRAGLDVPLAPMAHLLPADLELPDPGATTTADVLGLMARIMARFDRPAGTPRPLLVADDAGLLDPLSAALVGQLMAARTVFLLVTARAVGTGSGDLLAGLARADRVLRVDLGTLSRAEVETTLHLALGGPVDGPTGVGCWTYSAGNPLALRELVLDALERGALVESGGAWRLTGPLLGGDRAEALAASRLHGLTEAEREVLELLVLAGELGVADLESRYPPQLLERLEERGLIRARSDGQRLRVSVAHPLYEQAVRSGLSPLRARRRRRTVIDLLEGYGVRRREDRIVCAALRLDNNEPADPALLLRAAVLAAHARDHAQAERLARAAQQASPSPVAARLLAGALHELGRSAESLAVLDAVAGPLPPDDRLAFGLARANALYWGLGRPDQALAELHALAADPELGPRRHEVELHRVALAAYLGEIALAREVLSALPAGADSAVDTGMVRHTILLLSGEVEEALAVARATYAAAAAGSPGLLHPEIHLVNAVAALIELGRFAEAESMAGPLYDDATAAHLDTVYRWGPIAAGRLEVRRWAALVRGRLALDLARLRSAERWFREAAEPGETPVLPRARRLALAGVAVSAGQRRDRAVAAAAVAELDAIPGDPRAAWDLECDRGRAWAAAAGGALPVACEMLLAAAARAGRTGRPMLELRALLDLLRIGGQGAPLDRIAELAGPVRTPLAALAAAHAGAVRTADAAGLERAAEGYAAAGYVLFGAEAAEQAATLFRRQELRRRSIAAHNRSMVLRARCEEAATPALVSSVAAEPLSRREHEIALLVAAGETNKAISERLFLSVRTVENHVQRVLGKLGCARRNEVAAALGLDKAPPVREHLGRE